MKYLNNVDLNRNNQLQNALIHPLASDQSALVAADKGLIWFNTTTNLFRGADGSGTPVTLTNLLEQVAGTGAIQVTGVVGKSQTISVVAATGSVPGTMSAADKTKLDAATAANTASTIVLRDGSGNFTAGTITAALTGTASNASALGGATLAQVRDFSLTTGQRTATSAISDFDTQVRSSRLDQLASPTVALSINNQRLTNVADPTSPQDAATKNYVDAQSAGLDPKASVRAASTVNVAGTYAATGGTSGRGQFTAMPQIIDGVNLAAGNRVLLKNQTVGAQNGIWVVSTLGTGANGVWDRATDFDQDTEVTPGAYAFIEEGTTNATSGWVLATSGSITIGGASGTALSFAQFTGGTTYVAGSGLQLTGSTFAVLGTANRVTVGSTVDIASNYVGQASITTLGTITTGTWNGTTIALANGGTGATTAAAARANLGATSKFATDIGNGSLTSITVTHNLGTLDVQVALFENAGGAEVYANVTHASTNTITVAFTVAPTTNALRCVVIG